MWKDNANWGGGTDPCSGWKGLQCCDDLALADGTSFADSWGDSCSFYGVTQKCSAYGDCCANQGLTPNQACCDCGGGTAVGAVTAM